MAKKSKVVRNDQRALVVARLFQRGELASEQGRRHEMVLAGGHAPANQFARALEINQRDIRPIADDHLPIGALQR